LSIQIQLQHGFNVIQGQQKNIAHKPLLHHLVDPYEVLFYSLIFYWCDVLSLSNEYDERFLDRLKTFCFQADKVGALLYAAVGATLLQKLGMQDNKIKRLAVKYKNAPCIHLVDLVPRVEKWERALMALTQINSSETDSNSGAVSVESRMVWLLSLNGNYASIEPREQKIGKSGRWTKGRPVALKRLVNERDSFDYLTDQDNRICNQIEVEYEQSYYNYGRTEHFSLENDALIAAIGHPHVYWANAEKYDTPITINKSEPQLLSEVS
ncbi:hypothetical protein BMR05_14640, partial [Methylococcaceae bacterium HT4]